MNDSSTLSMRLVLVGVLIPMPFALSPSTALRTGYAQRSRRPLFDSAASAASLRANGNVIQDASK